MNVGDVYRAVLPEVGGREQHGPRPVVVLQDPRYGGRLPTVLVVPITKTAATLQFAGTLPIAKTDENGLTFDSVLLVFQLRVLDRNRFRERIGAVSPGVLAQIYAELDRLTGRPPAPSQGQPPAPPSSGPVGQAMRGLELD